MIPLAKNIKRYLSLRVFIIVFAAIIISVSTWVGVSRYLIKDVVINDDGSKITVKTMKVTVGEVLEQNGISLNTNDEINLPLDAELQRININEVNIKRAVPVSIHDGDEVIQVMTCADTVKEVLKDSSIELLDKDRLDSINLEDKISENMDIRVIRVSEKLVEENIAIPFETIKRENNRMDKGKEVVAKEGKEGTRQKVFRVVLENGKEILRELVKDSIIVNPINKIVEYGTILNLKTARGDTLRYKKVIEARATAYTSSFADTGKKPGHPQFGITYTGIKAKKGVIAVDPKVIPLGTRVYVEVPGSAPDYGYAIAADIGSAVKGNKIDVYLDDISSARKWGIKKVKVYILKN